MTRLGCTHHDSLPLAKCSRATQCPHATRAHRRQTAAGRPQSHRGPRKVCASSLKGELRSRTSDARDGSRARRRLRSCCWCCSTVGARAPTAGLALLPGIAIAVSGIEGVVTTLGEAWSRRRQHFHGSVQGPVVRRNSISRSMPYFVRASSLCVRRRKACVERAFV